MKELSCKTARWRQLKLKLNNLEPAAFVAAITDNQEDTILDVRTTDEVTSSGMLPHAQHFDYLAYDFWDRIEELDPEKVYYVYCRSGRRSIRTCTLMQNAGFKNVFNLDGGLNELFYRSVAVELQPTE